MDRKVYVGILVATILAGSATITAAKKDTCPDEYQRVSLAQVANMLKDYAGCKVEIEGQFMAVLDQETSKAYKTFIPKKYKHHVLFMLVGQAGGTATGAVLKENAGSVFELTPNDFVTIKGVVDASAAKSSDWNAFRLRGRQEELVVEVHEIAITGAAAEANPFEPATTSPSNAGDVAERLKQLKELFDQDIITEEKYQKKRAELLEQM